MKELINALNGHKTVIGLVIMQLAQNLADVMDSDFQIAILKTIYYIGAALAGVGAVHQVAKVVNKTTETKPEAPEVPDKP